MSIKNKKILICFIISTLIFTSIHIFSSLMARSPFLIPVYITSSNTISYIPLEDYVTGVVSCEMPSSFHIEALKAQAVASRTYAVAKIESHANPDEHPLAPLCDSTHCQVYSGSSANDYGYRKIKKAVHDTCNQFLYYNGTLVQNALYHASSGGKTENSEDVFSSAVPYLRSVQSPYETVSERNGHGVGMSQHGANGMAHAGYSYKKILSHYYSGTVVH